MTAAQPGAPEPPKLTERDLRRLRRRLPEHPTWEWARRRIVPVIELPEPTSDEPQATVAGPFGMRVGFGIGVDQVLFRIGRAMARSWDITDGELEDAALSNLRAQASSLGADEVGAMDHEGTTARFLTSPPANAAALVLVPDGLQRILGPEPQTLVTVSRGLLVSLPASAPAKLVWDFMTVIAALDPTPIEEGPFTLAEGRLDLWVPPEPMRRRVRLGRRRRSAQTS